MRDNYKISTLAVVIQSVLNSQTHACTHTDTQKKTAKRVNNTVYFHSALYTYMSWRGGQFLLAVGPPPACSDDRLVAMKVNLCLKLVPEFVMLCASHVTTQQLDLLYSGKTQAEGWTINQFLLLANIPSPSSSLRPSSGVFLTHKQKNWPWNSWCCQVLFPRLRAIFCCILKKNTHGLLCCCTGKQRWIAKQLQNKEQHLHERSSCSTAKQETRWIWSNCTVKQKAAIQAVVHFDYSGNHQEPCLIMPHTVAEASAQTLLHCLYSPCMQLPASTSVCTLRIPNTGSHTTVWTQRNIAYTDRNR